MNSKEIRSKLGKMMVPLPVLFNKDLSIDHSGLGKYISWIVEKNITNFCTTFVYSTLDSITSEESLEMVKTISCSLKNRGIFISCTAGGPLREVVDTVEDMGKAGADAVFVHPPLFVIQGGGGGLYFNYLCEVLKRTDIPIFSVALPDPWKSLNSPMLNIDDYAKLAMFENYMGFKDDIYQIPLRQSIAQKFKDRLCIIGGGDFKKYVVNCHLPGQSEFAGTINPVKYKEIFALLEENRYSEAISLSEEEIGIRRKVVNSDLNWIASRAVIFWAMGFCESYELRKPIDSATEAQANEILKKMHEYKDFFDGSLRQIAKGDEVI